MEALGLSLPVVILTVFALFRFSKALSSIAGAVDDKVSAVAGEIKASTVKDLAELEITNEEITNEELSEIKERLPKPSDFNEIIVFDRGLSDKKLDLQINIDKTSDKVCKFEPKLANNIPEIKTIATTIIKIPTKNVIQPAVCGDDFLWLEVG